MFKMSASYIIYIRLSIEHFDKIRLVIFNINLSIFVSFKINKLNNLMIGISLESTSLLYSITKNFEK